MVGRVLEALDESPYAEDTIIVLWSDHGLHLGEKLHWRKSTLWEESTHVPLIVVAPGVTHAGGVCSRSVSLMDVYPTLIDLCGLGPVSALEGKSLVALLKDPKASWDQPALTTSGYLNHALRSERWRYIRYANGSEELYDHHKDPLEWTNLAEDPDYRIVKEELAQWLPQLNAPHAPSMQ
jgi:arylsulfatase A-like enzyme